VENPAAPSGSFLGLEEREFLEAAARIREIALAVYSLDASERQELGTELYSLGEWLTSLRSVELKKAAALLPPRTGKQEKIDDLRALGEQLRTVGEDLGTVGRRLRKAADNVPRLPATGDRPAVDGEGVYAVGRWVGAHADRLSSLARQLLTLSVVELQFLAMLLTNPPRKRSRPAPRSPAAPQAILPDVAWSAVTPTLVRRPGARKPLDPRG
jgi:hypothetical protein